MFRMRTEDEWAAWCTVSGVCVQGEAEDEWQRGVQ